MYFSEGLMLVKVEIRHNGDTEDTEKIEKSLSANVCGWEYRPKDTGKDRRKGD